MGVAHQWLGSAWDEGSDQGTDTAECCRRGGRTYAQNENLNAGDGKDKNVISQKCPHVTFRQGNRQRKKG